MTRAGILLALFALLLLVPAAGAHGDVRGADDVTTLAPGESYDFEAGIHYHRLVGRVVAVDGVGSLEVFLAGPDQEGMRVAGPGAELQVNHLIPCCKDTAWAPHTVVVRNAGAAPVAARIDLVFLHDDFAVIVEDAETGAAWQTMALAILAVGIPAVVARRGASPDASLAVRRFRMGSWALAGAWLIVAVLSLVGMLRFGGGPLVGLRSAMAPVPIYSVFVNSFLLVMLAAFALWVVAVVGWVGAMRHAAPAEQAPRRFGLALAVGPVVFGVLLAAEYGNVVYALALGAIPAAIILAAALVPRRMGGTPSAA